MSNDATTWVVGCDGSNGAEHAIDWCRANAPGRATRLHVVQAWHYPTLVAAAVAPIPDIDVEPVMAHPDPERLASGFGEIGIELTTAVHYGVTANVLLDASTDSGLLVLGTRGLGGFGRLVIGSVSHQCATHARVPVAVVPDAGVADRAVRRIVVGMDGSPGACAALRWAFAFAPSGVAIQVVGAWQPASWGESIDLYTQSDTYGKARVAFDSIVDEIESTSPSLRCERHFGGGHAADELLDAAAGADLIVVGERGHRGFKAALLGSTATEVLHRAELTTVIVPVPHDEQ